MFTKEQVKEFFANEVNQVAVKEYKKAKAFAEAERIRVNAYSLPLLEEYKVSRFIYDERQVGRRSKATSPDSIKTTGDLFILSKANDEIVAEYFSDLDKLHKENGFFSEPGYCPALVAEEQERKAAYVVQKSLFALVEIDINEVWNMKHRAKALDIAVRAFDELEALESSMKEIAK